MASFDNQSKSSATYINQSRNSTEYSSEDAFLLQEIGDYLLQETGYKIDISYGDDKSTTTFINQAKN